LNFVDIQIIRSIAFFIAASIVLALQQRHPHQPASDHARTNIEIWLIDIALIGIACGGCAYSVANWTHEAGLGLLQQVELPVLITIPTTVLALDLTSYVWHRANHAAPFLWRFHQAHHSDSHYAVTTALRFHPGELLFALPLRLLVILFLGLPVEGIIAFEITFTFANLWEHGNINLATATEKTIGRLAITPSIHRRHHSIEPELLNSNYGTILSIWDRLGGTFGDASSTDRVEIGLRGIADSLTTNQVLGMPARDCRQHDIDESR